MRNAKIVGLVFLLTTALLSLSGPVATAIPIHPKDGIPDFWQFAKDEWGDNFCAPTVAADSFWYFANVKGYKDLVKEEPAGLITTLGKYMNTTKDGTQLKDAQKGLEDFIKDRKCDPANRPKDGLVVGMIGFPTFDDIVRELAHGQDLILLGIPVGQKWGHYFGAEGYDTAANVNPNAWLVDPKNDVANEHYDSPLDPKKYSYDPYLVSSTKEKVWTGTKWEERDVLSFPYQFGNTWYFHSMIHVSAVPEPATLLLVIFGLIALAGFARRRQK